MTRPRLPLTILILALLGHGSASAQPTLGQRLRHAKLSLTAALSDRLAPLIGVAELLGVRYPVKTYQARVDDQLTRGSRLGAAEVKSLRDRGYRSIVTLLLERNVEEDAAARELGLKQLRIPILDNTAPTQAQMKQFVAFARDPANGPVYVHCQAGQGRTGVAVAAYRMAASGWTTGRAIAEAQRFGLKLRSQKLFLRQFGAALHEARQ